MAAKSLAKIDANAVGQTSDAPSCVFAHGSAIEKITDPTFCYAVSCTCMQNYMIYGKNMTHECIQQY